MGFMDYYFDALRNYVNFVGSTGRKAFWMFVLISFLISVVIAIVEGILGLSSTGGGGPLSGLYSLFMLIPSIAIAVRRLHDINKSGWWILIGLIPILGWIVLIYFYVQPSKQAAVSA